MPFPFFTTEQPFQSPYPTAPTRVLIYHLRFGHITMQNNHPPDPSIAVGSTALTLLPFHRSDDPKPSKLVPPSLVIAARKVSKSAGRWIVDPFSNFVLCPSVVTPYDVCIGPYYCQCHFLYLSASRLLIRLSHCVLQILSKNNQGSAVRLAGGLDITNRWMGRIPREWLRTKGKGDAA